MNHLPSVIGPAPSELPWQDLLRKLRGERERVRLALESWATGKFKTPKDRKAKGVNLTSIRAISKEMGISVEEVERMFSEEVERRKESESNKGNSRPSSLS